MKRNSLWIKGIGRFFCFFLLASFSFYSEAYPAPADYYDQVQKIYIGYYQRPADPGGLLYWAGELDRSGGSLTSIIEAFAHSAESQALYGPITSANIATVVNDIYNALLARNAEDAGRDYYVGEFNAGRFTSATIMLNVLFGTTGGPDLLSINNKLAAANLFTRTIDPELDGLNFQVTYSGDGDAIAGRNFLSLVTSDPATVQTQAGTTAYIQPNIADPNDAIQTVNVPGAWSYVPAGTVGTFTTALGVTGLPSSLGSADQYMAVLKIGPLAPGQPYEGTLYYTGGTDIGYGHAWVDGNPFGRNWASFLGIGTGTGTWDYSPAKQAKVLFTSDSQSTSTALYWVIRTSRAMTFSFGVSGPSGVTRDSQDQWGYFYVDDYRSPPWQFIR